MVYEARKKEGKKPPEVPKSQTARKGTDVPKSQTARDGTLVPVERSHRQEEVYHEDEEDLFNTFEEDRQHWCQKERTRDYIKVQKILQLHQVEESKMDYKIFKDGDV